MTTSKAARRSSATSAASACPGRRTISTEGGAPSLKAERLDSRRLPGPNLLWDRPGAVVDASVADELAARLIAAWAREARRILDAVGWHAEAMVARAFAGGVSLVLSAPIDALYTATEVNEWAFDAALLDLSDEGEHDRGPSPDGPAFAEAVERLRALIEAERRPRLLALEAAASTRGVAFVFDDQRASVGLGSGSLTWTIDEIPDVLAIPWEDVHDVPIALVTGTNGKTTTVRMLGAMLAAAGLVPGISSTDGVTVGGQPIATGDYSGPEGARLAVRDTRVQAAVLETARGGILRRGLTVRRANAALVTNVADDHMGELGVHDLDALARVKLVVGRVIGPAGRLVLNADDPRLVAIATSSESPAPLAWFSLDATSPVILSALAAGCDVAFEEDGALVLATGTTRATVARVADVPATLGGAARYNVANALGAILVAQALGVPHDAMAQGLAAFVSTPAANPGRANVFDVSGAKVIVDFAHNPHGMTALLETAALMPANRRLVLIGQAGDRDEAALRALARVTADSKPDRVIVKEMPRLLRGRADGEITAIMVDELLQAGVPAESIGTASSEPEGVSQALAWARPGDLLLLTIHSDRKQVLAELTSLTK